MTKKFTAVFTGVVTALLASTAMGATIKFQDPKGDDNGPGTYIYPTDAVYKKGSFDLREAQIKTKGDKVEFSVKIDSQLEDPWGMGSGFAVQMAFIFIDTDGKAGSGHTDGLPGLNIKFDPANAWDKVVLLSPQKQARVYSEVNIKAVDFKDDIVVPGKTKGKGRKIAGTVDLAELGGGDPSTWSYQIVLQSNEGFPAKTDLLTRKVNEFEGQHRFGGGSDGDCDPHVIDLIAGKATGDKSEIDAQHQMLAYECDDDFNAVKPATLKMVRP